MFGIVSKGVKIKIGEKKELPQVIKMPSPDKVYIPLIQHVGKPAYPIVDEGDYVRIGERIGKSDVFISGFIHSSVSGKIKKIEDILHPKLKKVKGIVIENDHRQKKNNTILEEKRNVEDISPSEIIDSIREAGIVGMGGASFPTHVKLSPPEGKTVNSYILNGAECEPLLKVDSSLMANNAEQVILGMKLAMKAVGVRDGYVGIEKDNVEVINVVKEAIKSLEGKLWKANIRVHVLPISYPQGAEKQIIKTILGREVPPGGLPYEVGTIVNNVATCYSIYEGVVYKKPLYERVVTVAGDCIEKSLNLLVPIGTTIKEILDYCDIRLDVEKLALGGPMMGEAQYDLDTPIIKGTTGIVLFKRSVKEEEKEVKCIRCGRCINTCPVNLIPTRLAQLVKEGLWEELENYNIEDCIECGCCSYVCPSNIPLVHLIKLGKSRKDNS